MTSCRFRSPAAEAESIYPEMWIKMNLPSEGVATANLHSSIRIQLCTILLIAKGEMSASKKVDSSAGCSQIPYSK